MTTFLFKPSTVSSTNLPTLISILIILIIDFRF